MKDFAVFILTNGRPDEVVTYNTLRKQGYTGKIYIIIDNEDDTADKYYKNFEDVIMFNKEDYHDKMDLCDNFESRKTILYVRQAVWDIAKDLNIKYFMQLDDDYTYFNYRYIDNKYSPGGAPKNLDKYFNSLLDFYKSIKGLHSVCMSQGGDFIGGVNCGMIQNYKNQARKAMNSFICSTDRPFKFNGRINSDVSVYTNLGSKGYLFLTIPFVGLEQIPNQAKDSGMSALSKKQGTYIKSFYSVMQSPSFVKISIMGVTEKRIHHLVNWENAVPKILNEKHKKCN